MQMEQERKIDSPIITLEHVEKEFVKVKEGGTFKVVEDLNVQVRENEFLVLFGPGQCGKTTILNMIAGFEDRMQAVSVCTEERYRGRTPPGEWYFRILPFSPG